jgi:phytoene dehydrogenase-like protein
MPGPTRDVVIIGGGHNGLACAAYLARAGLDVLVLERREVLGCAAVTEEPWPGYRVSSASYVVSLMPPQIVKELGLRRFGYRVSILEPDYWVPYPDGSSLTLWEDAGRTAEEIARFSKADADAYLEFDPLPGARRKVDPAPQQHVGVRGELPGADDGPGPGRAPLELLVIDPHHLGLGEGLG